MKMRRPLKLDNPSDQAQYFILSRALWSPSGPDPVGSGCTSVLLRYSWKLSLNLFLIFWTFRQFRFLAFGLMLPHRVSWYKEREERWMFVSMDVWYYFGHSRTWTSYSQRLLRYKGLSFCKYQCPPILSLSTQFHLLADTNEVQHWTLCTSLSQRRSIFMACR